MIRRIRPRIRTASGGFWPGLVWVLGMAATVSACRPPEKIVVLYPQQSEAARDVLDMSFVQQITMPDLLVLRPDEFSAVAPDHQRHQVYVGGREGRLLALDIDDGRVLKEQDFGGAISGTPVLTDDNATMLLGTDNGVLHAIDLDNWEARWTYATEGTIRVAPVVRDGVVFFSNSHQDVYALDLRDGRWRWQYSRDLPGDVSMIHGRAGLTFVDPGPPPVPPGGMIVTGFDDGKVVALAATSCEPIWVGSVAPPEGGAFVDCDSTPLVDPQEGEVVVSGQQSGVVGLGLEDGIQRWMFPVRGASTVVPGPADLLLFSSSLEGVFAIERGGTLRWRTQADPGVLSAPIVVGRTVFVTHADVGVIALDALTGQTLAVVDTGSGMSSMPVYDPTNRRFYVISNRGLLMAFRVGDVG